MAGVGLLLGAWVCFDVGQLSPTEPLLRLFAE